MDHHHSAETLASSQFSSSSRTDSQHTNHSKATAKSQDFHVDNTMSPIDLEGRIQTERLTVIIDEIIYKTKIVVCLPHLIKEYTTLSSVLSREHMDDLLVIFEQYESPYNSYTSLLNSSAIDDIKASQFTLKHRISPELSHLIFILSNYPELRAKVEEMSQQLKDMYTNTTLPPKLLYLETLEEFRELMVVQMETSAAVDLEKKLHLRKVKNSNKELEKSINEYLKTMAEEGEAFNKTMSKKQVVLSKLEKELALLNSECNNKISKQVLDSERQMVLATRAHVVKSEMLREEEAETCENYRNMLLSHLSEEKKMRLRRFKAQTQLVSWLQKYDQEMGDKQADLEEITRNYEDEAAKVVKLEAELAEQDVEYIPLMNEREAEYEAEMAEKMATVMREHAARVIQFAWREVLANRKEKRRPKGKGKKGGSKKK